MLGAPPLDRRLLEHLLHLRLNLVEALSQPWLHYSRISS